MNGSYSVIDKLTGKTVSDSYVNTFMEEIRNLMNNNKSNL